MNQPRGKMPGPAPRGVLSRAPEVPLLRLETVWFQVTGTFCNLACTHCFISCGPGVDRHKMMERSRIREYLEEGKQLGAKEFYFTGGEPFLHPDIYGILEDSLGFGPTTVLTNGTLLTGPNCRRLAEIRDRSAHPLEIRVSLDHYTPQKNDEIRGKNAFGMAMKGLRNLVAVGFRPIVTCSNLPSESGQEEDLDSAARNERDLRRGFEELARRENLEGLRLKILPPLLMGAEAKRSRPYRREERVSEKCMEGFDVELLQCSTSRMVTAAGVHVCPILIDEPGSLMGRTLAETLRPFPLAYSACYTCRVSGLSCRNENISEIRQEATKSHSPPLGSEVKTMKPRNGNGNGDRGSCCPSAVPEVSRDEVKRFYAEAAAKPKKELCCPTAYDPDDISYIPAEVREVSYGCGSPVVLAGLKTGETMVDLGCGAGIDCFIAAKKAGPKGRVIGVDMTDEMLLKALENAPKVARRLGYHNVEFRKGFLEEIPADDGCADLVTSNCVVNLSPDKRKVFREIARILKSDGRFVISDIVSEVEIPEEMRKDRELWGECISGALPEKEFLARAREAGFHDLEILKKDFYKEVRGYRFWSVTVRGWKTPRKNHQMKAKSCSPAGGKPCC